MEIRASYVPELDLAVFTLSGEADDEELRRVVTQATASKHHSPSPKSEVIDVRGVGSVDRLTVQGTIDAARTLKEWSDGAFPRVVVLVPEAPVIFGLARVFTTIAEAQGQESMVTRSVRQAGEWFGLSGDDLEFFVRLFARIPE